jgi:hypothetical protein
MIEQGKTKEIMNGITFYTTITAKRYFKEIPTKKWMKCIKLQGSALWRAQHHSNE